MFVGRGQALPLEAAESGRHSVLGMFNVRHVVRLRAAAGALQLLACRSGRPAVADAVMLVAGGALVLSACSGGEEAARPSASIGRVSPSPYAGSRTAGAGGYKVGPPYRIGSQWYVPHEDPSYDRVGVASWYGADFHGRLTANGETYNMEALTAAHTTLPLPSYVTVTNVANGRTILVRVNDRGPYVGGRIIDLSHAAARALGTEQRGTATVRVRYAGRAPLNGDTLRERAFLAQQPWYRPAMAEQETGWGARWSLGGVFSGW